MLNPLQLLLYPFSVLYATVMRVRNYMYDRGLKPAASFDLPVINVGNLTVGGTGKTPMIEYLVRLLAPYKVATLSRGYGRDTKGSRIASEHDNASTIGDEPYQIYRKFGKEVTVSVGEERALAIPMILQEKQETQIILLDDAYQHRRVRPSFNILLCDYNRPFYRDVVFPAGRLREPRSGAARADVIVVTKCPESISDTELTSIRQTIFAIDDKPVFFTTVVYDKPVPVSFNVKPFTGKVLLVTGIANATPLVEYVRNTWELVDHLEFSDHHTYSSDDLSRMKNLAERSPGCSILTTEKDVMRLDNSSGAGMLAGIPVHYLPITVRFLSGGNDFDQLILNHVREAV